MKDVFHLDEVKEILEKCCSLKHGDEKDCKDKNHECMFNYLNLEYELDTNDYQESLKKLLKENCGK